MLRLALALLTGGVSSSCGLAAVGLALYAHGPSALAAAQLFGGIGFAVGLACGAVHQFFDGQPALGAVAQPRDVLGALASDTLARAAAPRPVAPAPARNTGAVAALTAQAPRQFAGSAFGA